MSILAGVLEAARAICFAAEEAGLDERQMEDIEIRVPPALFQRAIYEAEQLSLYPSKKRMPDGQVRIHGIRLVRS